MDTDVGQCRQAVHLAQISFENVQGSVQQKQDMHDSSKAGLI